MIFKRKNNKTIERMKKVEISRNSAYLGKIGVNASYYMVKIVHFILINSPAKSFCLCTHEKMHKIYISDAAHAV